MIRLSLIYIEIQFGNYNFFSIYLYVIKINILDNLKFVVIKKYILNIIL